MLREKVQVFGNFVFVAFWDYAGQARLLQLTIGYAKIADTNLKCNEQKRKNMDKIYGMV